jgi:hypothetical protein
MRSLETGEDYLDRFFAVTGGVREVGKGLSFFLLHRVELEGRPEGRYFDTLTLASFGALRLRGDPSSRQRQLCDPIARFLRDRGCPVPDGELDDVFVTRLRDRTLTFNAGTAVRRKRIMLGDVTWEVDIDPAEIVELPGE